VAMRACEEAHPGQPVSGAVLQALEADRFVFAVVQRRQPLHRTEDAIEDDDPDAEERWCAAARDGVVEYLAREGVEHGEVGEWPAWHVAPVASVWAMESIVSPGRVGWWAIYGDLPTDYVSAARIRHPREAIRAFAGSWTDYVSTVRRGDPHPDLSIGGEAPSEELLAMMTSRAETLAAWAEDDTIWHGL
jgi:hypothetical protein